MRRDHRPGQGPISEPAVFPCELRLNEGYGVEAGKRTIDRLLAEVERGNISFVLQLNVQPPDHPEAERVRRELAAYARARGLPVTW